VGKKEACGKNYFRKITKRLFITRGQSETMSHKTFSRLKIVTLSFYSGFACCLNLAE
jgi:hypothetical protein